MITGINHITIATKDLGKSFNFYTEILGFKPLCRWHQGAYLLAGDLWFCLSFDANTSASVDYNHIAFTVSQADFVLLKEKIITNKTEVFKSNQSEGDSLYFLDPDGHKLEIHVGDWQSRIAHKKQNLGTWQDVEFFI